MDWYAKNLWLKTIRCIDNVIIIANKILVASNCIFVRLQITGIIQFVPHALIFSSVKKRVRPQNQLLKLVYKKVLLYCLLSYSKRSKMKAVFDRNLRKMMCVSLTLLAKSCKILSDRKWFKMTHFQKCKAIFNFPQKEVISKHFCKIEQKGGQKTTNMYLVFT